MLTFRETNLLVASELDERYRIKKEIYYSDTARDVKHIHNEQTDRFTCGYCNKSIRRIDSFKKHLNGCTVRIITESFQNKDFKQYEVTQDNNRLELMMPYNPERGIRMYISGPPRCGKSYLIRSNNKRIYQTSSKEKNILIFTS